MDMRKVRAGVMMIGLLIIFYSPSATKNPTGIMNDAYDQPGRPQTYSFEESYSSVHDQRPSAAYVYQENGPSKPHLPSSSSTLGFLPPKKRKRENPCGIKCILITLLVLFIILFLVMIVLYFTRDSSSEKGKVDGKNATESEVVNMLTTNGKMVNYETST